MCLSPLATDDGTAALRNCTSVCLEMQFKSLWQRRSDFISVGQAPKYISHNAAE